MKKNQKVYQACTYFAHKGDTIIMTVIERTVHSCGKKELTFVDYGFDGVYGRTVFNRNGIFPEIFETREQAYKYLEGINDRFDRIILRGEYTDRDRRAFEAVR